jgi:hypothetical protein
VAYPTPSAGLVIRYSYLWQHEALKGNDEGVKDRPCAIILAQEIIEGETQVVVLPVTHEPPSDPNDAIEIPADTKRRLGLDDQQSWIVLTEANSFVWPGPDLRPKQRADDATDIAYGQLPKALFDKVRDTFLRYFTTKTATVTKR